MTQLSTLITTLLLVNSILAQGIIGAEVFINPAGNDDYLAVIATVSGGVGINTAFSGVADGASMVNTGIFAYAAGASTNYAGYFDGPVTITGALTYPPSDLKLKKNILGIHDALKKILLLRPTEYEYLTDTYRGMNLPFGRQCGFIAQEMQQVFPEFVTTNVNLKPPGERRKEELMDDVSIESSQYLGINSISLIPVLTAGIQEQQKMIDTQQLIINQLNEKIDELSMLFEQRLNAIELNNIKSNVLLNNSDQ